MKAMAASSAAAAAAAAAAQLSSDDSDDDDESHVEGSESSTGSESRFSGVKVTKTEEAFVHFFGYFYFLFI